MFYWKILLNSVNSQLIHSIFTSLWIFFSPTSPACFTCLQALLQAHWFFKTDCTLFSHRVDLISCTAMLRRQTATSAGAGTALHACCPRGGQQLPLWDLCKGQCCSFPASHGPHGLGEMQMSPQPVARAQGQLAKSIWAATPGSAHASACPGEVVLGQTPRLQSNRLNANKSDLNIEPEWLLPLLFKLLASPFSPPQPEARWNL